MPRDWYDLLRDFPSEGGTFRDYHSPRRAERAAIEAFAELPADRRAELLAGAPATEAA